MDTDNSFVKVKEGGGKGGQRWKKGGEGDWDTCNNVNIKFLREKNFKNKIMKGEKQVRITCNKRNCFTYLTYKNSSTH